MGCKKISFDKNVKNKLMSGYLVFTLLAASFILVPNVKAEGPDVITTYFYDGFLQPDSEFDLNDTVIINITVDNVTGDIEPPHSMKAVNENTSEWITFFVTDNQSIGPWGGNNPGDGEYWGDFNLTKMESTFNASTPSETSILKVNAGNIVNISEIPSTQLDNDDQIAFKCITVSDFSPPGPGGDLFVNTTVCGFVNDTMGDPIGGVNVSACNMSEGWCNWSFTDGSGYFEFMVFGGDFQLQASCEGYEVYQDYRTYQANDSFFEEISLAENSGGSEGENITVNITIMGSIYQDFTPDLPIEGVNVSIFACDETEHVIDYTFTDYEGYFEMVAEITANEWEIQAMDIQLNFSADGYRYRDGHFPNANLGWLIQDMDCVWDVYEGHGVYLEKIWETNSTIVGYIINDTGAAIAEAVIFAEGPNYYFNETESNEAGYFEMKIITGDFEICVQKSGFFINCTETTIEEAVTDLGNICLEEIPESSAWINGSVTSNGSALPFVEIMLIDPLHPDEGMKENMPITDENGIFNISTYPGQFKLVTVARIIGEQMEAPPIGIGGYVNEIIDVTVNESETELVNISLNPSDPDEITVHLRLLNWSNGSINMVRTIEGNAKVIRTMIDEDISGNISIAEIDLLCEDINDSMQSMEDFQEEYLYAGIPFEGYIDGIRMYVVQPTIEVAGIGVNSTIDSSDSITIYINGTIVLADEVDSLEELHSVTLTSYYDNAAFTMNQTIQAPNGFSFVDSTDEYVSITGLDSSNVTVNIDEDPNNDDLTFTEDISLLASSSGSSVFAEMNQTYYQETPFDSDGDSDYDFLFTKFKFNTNETGTFRITGTLKGSSGTILARDDHEGFYQSGVKLVELSFDGKQINKKQRNGYYEVIINLYFEQNDTFVWIDSINKTTTNSYLYTDFTSPALYFTSDISDSVADDNENGLYDSFIVTVFLYVGETGNYELESDIGIAGFSSDPHISHMRKDVTFMETGFQSYNFTFDGSLIYQKASNSSLWVDVRARSYTEGELDEIMAITDQYFYTDFERPLPESCSYQGNVTNVFGQPLETEVRLMNLETYYENTTVTDQNGSFSINLQPGMYEANFWCTNGSDYDGHWEYVSIGNEDVNETIIRQIILMPNWGLTSWLDWMMDDWQYAAGDPVYINITSYEMPLSNASLEVYRELEIEEFYIEEYIISYENQTDENGASMFVINTSSFANGQYMFKLAIYNASQQLVARGDVWDVQISSISLDFDINKNNYRPGSSGQGSYNLTYISNGTEVTNATYSWSIKYWDWMGEHILDSGEFTNNVSGSGDFEFSIPSSIPDNVDWFDLQFKATDPSGSSIQSWRGFGITSGTVIDSVTDESVDGSNGYDGLSLNVTVNVTAGQEGNYRVSGNLDSQNWYWITGNETEQYLNEGDNYVEIFFEGDQIQNSGQSGSYRVWVGLYHADDWNELDNFEYNTDTEYNSNDFCRPVCYFETTSAITNETIGSVDNYDALIVNVSINSSAIGNYTVHANLYHEVEQSGGWMDWYHVAWNSSQEIEINTGQLNTSVSVPIRFEGTEIYGSNQEGPWKLNFNLHQITTQGWEEWISSYDPETEIDYSYTQFTKPNAFIENIIDYGSIDGDLIIGAVVNVSSGSQGWYQLNGDLHSSHNEGHWWIDNDWNQTELSNGTNIVNLSFSGSAIYSSGYNGPYNVFINLEQTDPTWQWLGGNEYDTDVHAYDDFSMPEAVFTGSYSDEGIDEDGDGYYDYLRLIVPVEFNETGYYEVNGELYQEDEDNWNWYWITWGHKEFDIENTSTVNVTIDFSGSEIRKSGIDGTYGVNLWLRDMNSGNELGYFDFDTLNSYDSTDFEQSAVRFTDDSPLSDSMSSDNSTINVTLKVNSSETGTYRLHGGLHKVIQHPGWDEWMWLTSNEIDLSIVEGEQTINFSFDTAMIQDSGYDGPYMAEFDLMDENWMNVDFLRDYETNAYSLSGIGDIRPAYFTDDFYDYQYPSTDPDSIKVNVTLQINESGYYEIGGDLHKDVGMNWNFIAGSWVDRYFSTGQQNITLRFDAIEILDNIDMMGLDEFDSGDTFDLDVWLRESGGWLDLDHLSTETIHTYQTSDFTSSFSAVIDQISDNAYNDSDDEAYEYLNITAQVNFSETGEYELWCDLNKETDDNWYWINWKNEFITISDSDLGIPQNITIQFSGERISSEGYDGPYNYHMELWDWNQGQKVDQYDSTTSLYNAADFVGSSVSFNDSSATAEGIDSADAGTEYDYLKVQVNVSSDDMYNVELRGDLHKETNYDWQWISWKNNWTTINEGDNTLSLRFDGGIIRSSDIDGPYQIRIELWDTNTWEMLDVIDRIETTAYSADNFQASAAEINQETTLDCGLDENGDGKYEYLQINVSVNVSTAGEYEIMGDLHSDSNGWNWLGWTNNWTYLSSGPQTVNLQFNGLQIKNKQIDGPYQVRIELRDDTGNMLSMVDPYDTNTYDYTSFQGSGVELVGASDRIIENGDYLELNITINCTTNGSYWIGTDLHKESGWDWQWISWESRDIELSASDEPQNITMSFSGQMIRNSEIDGPYQIRIELRDQETWSEMDLIERYNTQDYYYTDFSEPEVSILSIEDSGNDTNDDDLYNYLDLNLTINCTQEGTYWLDADIHKESDAYWQGIAWKGEEITLTGDGEQIVKFQFDGEQIYNRGINGPYQVHLEISNVSTWTRLDTYDRYNTQSYVYTDFQRSSIEFVENITSPSDRGVGTVGSYSYLEINVSVFSNTSGTYWLNADLHKQSGWNWQWISWQGQEITHNGTGNETFTILFDGGQIRNKGIDGPYQVRLELNSVSGEWKQYDVIEEFSTNVYNASDFASSGIEFVDPTDATMDQINSGNLVVNVTVNSSTNGEYEIGGDLHKESDWNWQWISWNSTQVEVDDSGEQTFQMVFEGSDISDSEIDGPYNIRFELKKIGTWSMVDDYDYETQTYTPSQFSASSEGLNCSEFSDSAPNNEYLLINLTSYSNQSVEYQFDCWLHGENWEFIGWNKTIATVQGFDNITQIRFDASIINNSGVDPAKAYIEMRKTSSGTIVDYCDYDLEGTYTANDFTSGIEIDTSSISATVWDSDDDGYNNTLNVSVSIDFTSPGTYEITAGLKDNSTRTWIAGDAVTDSYSAQTNVTLQFDGLKIYKSEKNGPYLLSFISISKEGIGEILRETNAFLTEDYDYTDFQHPNISAQDAEFSGEYSSYVIDSDNDSKFGYLVVNATVNVSNDGIYDFYADLYTEDGSIWVSADSNESLNLTAGNHTIKFFFEGNDLYESQQNGPYLLGLVRVSADIEGSWFSLDEQSNVHTTASYNYDDFESETQMPLLGATTPEGVTSVAVSNDPFSPNSDGSKDTTLITVSATTGQTLYINIYNETNVRLKTGMVLSENEGTGTYTVTWQGKDDGDTTVSDGTYRIKISSGSSGEGVNESEETTTVVVDTQAPTGSTITINSGDSHTNSSTVTLTIYASDNSTKKMRFKNAGGNWTDWEDYQTSKTWTLSSTDGSKTVSFQSKDTAENIASTVTDSITLDTTEPSRVNISITGKGDTPSTYTNDVSVTLSITAEDATSSIQYMKLSNDMDFSDVSWINYSTSKEWTLNSGDGVKTVYIKVKDMAGKESDIYQDNITLDTSAPTGVSISINSGRTYTNATNVTLTLVASGANKMRFSNNGSSYSSYESFSTEKSWTLSSSAGTKKVYLKVKDIAGNIATAVNDTIVLDTTAPVISGVDSSGIAQTSATITWTTNEGATSYVQYGTTTEYGSNTTLDSTKVTSHSETITNLNPGTTYHFKVKSRDEAGNERSSSDDTFTTSSGSDTTAPSAIEGLSVTDKADAEQTLRISWNQSDASDFAGYRVYRRTSSFTNVSSSGVSRIATVTSRTTTHYDDTSATDGTRFHYAVTAIDTSGNENQAVSSSSGVSVDDKAPVTTDDIPVGWQTSDVTVTLSASDGGQGVNKTYYTIDGSDPTNSSNSNRTQYTSPFSVGGDNPMGDNRWTIKYYSYDKNSTPNVEGVHTVTLKVDTADPTTTDDAPSGWQNNSVYVTLNATDETSGVSKTYYTKDGSTPTTSSSQYSSPVLVNTDGNRTLKYFSKDNATNTESIHTSYLLIDATNPSSSVTALSTYNSVPFNVSWTSSDTTSGIANVSIQYKNGTGNWTNWLTDQSSSGSALFNSTYAGIGYTYYFRSIAMDNASNTESVSTYDAMTTTSSTNITAEITSPSNAAYVKGNITFIGSATSNNFSRYYLNYSADNSTWTNIANDTSSVTNNTLGTLNSSTISDGTYTIQLIVWKNDSSNNSYSITITVDNSAPTISTNASASVTSNSATITWATNESTNATVEYGSNTSYGSTVSGSPLTFETSHSETITGLSASTTYHYRVISYDRAGNNVTSSDANFTTSAESTDDGDDSGGGGGGFLPPAEENQTNTTDNLPTITNIYHEPSTITNNDYVRVYATVTDDNQISSVTLYYGPTGETETKTMTLKNDDIYSAEIGLFEDGQIISYWVVALDNASQSTKSATSTFHIVDNNGPSITIKYPKANAEIFDQTPTIRIIYSDHSGVNLSTIAFKIDEQMMTSFATITETSLAYTPSEPLTFDHHTLSFSVSDSEGNSNSIEWSFIIIQSDVVIEEEIGNITTGESVELIPDNSDQTGINKIDIISTTNLTDVKVTVVKLQNKPENITDPSDKNVYAYLDLQLSADDEDVNENSIDTINISFKILLSWFKANDVSKDSVTLMRYHDGIWQQLETTYVSEDTIFAYFTAETPGFSTFAITGDLPVEDEFEMPWIVILLGLIAAIIMVALIVLVKKGVIEIRR